MCGKRLSCKLKQASCQTHRKDSNDRKPSSTFAQYVYELLVLLLLLLQLLFLLLQQIYELRESLLALLPELIFPLAWRPRAAAPIPASAAQAPVVTWTRFQSWRLRLAASTKAQAGTSAR